MLEIEELSKKVGKKVLFIGTETYNWTVADFTKAARNARVMGFDTICPKRADGTYKWYQTAGHLQLERQAVLAEGVGYIPFTYMYGPKTGYTSQECDILKEIMSICDGLVVADMEVEWNGQSVAATQMASFMKNAPGDLLVTTWGDPNLQNWQGVIAALSPVVSAWVPQEYTIFLLNEEGEWSDKDREKMFPAIDITGEFAVINPLAVAKQILNEKHFTLFVWEYMAALNAQSFIQGALAAFTNTVTQITPAPLPHPKPSDKKTQNWKSYVVESGDTLSGIAAKLGLDDWNTDLYQPNKAVFDSIAKQHGFADSQGGSLIFPGTHITYLAK